MKDAKMPPRIRGAVAPLVLLVVLPGCGGSTGMVSGKVVLGGATPVTSGVVVFTAADGVPFSAPIDGAGHYKLTKLPLGVMRISVVNSMVRPGDAPVKAPDAHPAFPPTPPIPPRYENLDNGLKCTVVSGSQIYDIALSP